MSTSMMHKHLRQYAEDGIKQKVRLSNLATDYSKQEVKTRERIIDQTALVKSMRERNFPSEKIDITEQRLKKDEQVLEQVQRYIKETEQEAEHMMLSLTTHMEELTAIEVAAGGFVTHPIGEDKNVKYNKDTGMITFFNDGHVEIPIGTRMNSWKDSSQLTIQKNKKAGKSS